MANVDKKVENINFNHKINISVSESFEVDAQMRINHFESSWVHYFKRLNIQWKWPPGKPDFFLECSDQI